MSGGHFQYNQYKIRQIADEIKEVTINNNSTEQDRWGQDKGRHFLPETIAKFQLAIEALNVAEIMAQRIDWLLSGDDGEESFHRRWDEELAKEASSGIQSK